MSSNIFYPLFTNNDREIGYITSMLGVVYLAYQIVDEDYPYPVIAIVLDEDKVELIPARRQPKTLDNEDPPIEMFWAIVYDKEVDDRIKEMVDVLIAIRLGHPSITQLELDISKPC